MTDTKETTEKTAAFDLEQIKGAVEKAVYATVGAGVTAGRKIAAIDVSGKYAELKDVDYKAKAEEYGTKAKDSFTTAAGDWTKVGEETIGDLRTKVDVDDLTHKVGEAVHVDQWQEQAGKLRGQLEDLVTNWRTNFTPEVETVKDAAEKVGETAKKAATEVSATAKKAATEVSATTKATVTELTTDDLTVIDGVGPTYAARLVEAGIDTFKALAKAEPAKVAEIAKVSEKAAAGWVVEAKTV